MALVDLVAKFMQQGNYNVMGPPSHQNSSLQRVRVAFFSYEFRTMNLATAKCYDMLAHQEKTHNLSVRTIITHHLPFAIERAIITMAAPPLLCIAKGV